MQISSTSLAALLVLIVWFSLNFVGVDRLVSAEPFNSLAGLNLAALLAILVAGLLRTRGAAIVLFFVSAVWIYLQVETHWSGYALGASEKRLAWYERVWGENWSFLPEIQGHTVPDGYHTVLFFLIIVTAASALRDSVVRAK
jgi:hypothetical protein